MEDTTPITTAVKTEATATTCAQTITGSPVQAYTPIELQQRLVFILTNSSTRYTFDDDYNVKCKCKNFSERRATATLTWYTGTRIHNDDKEHKAVLGLTFNRCAYEPGNHVYAVGNVYVDSIGATFDEKDAVIPQRIPLMYDVVEQRIMQELMKHEFSSFVSAFMKETDSIPYKPYNTTIGAYVKKMREKPFIMDVDKDSVVERVDGEKETCKHTKPKSYQEDMAEQAVRRHREVEQQLLNETDANMLVIEPKG